LQPGFTPAIESAFRVLRQSSPPSISEVTALGRKLVERGSGAYTAAQIHILLRAWNTSPQASELLTVLVQYYAAASIDPIQFEKSEWGDLHSLGVGSAVSRPIDEIHTAYFSDFPPSLHRGPAQDIFRSWAHPQQHAEVFSALLKKVGSYYYQHEKPDRAMARYSAAWMLNPADSESAVYSAAILRDHAKSLDPTGVLFGRLLETLFQQKGEAYFENDWPNILRFHVVLGTIFERDKVWGSSQDPRSAIFQWESALRAESQVRQIDKNFPPSPGIHASLGLAYQNTSRTADAWDQYILAAQGFIQTHNPDSATVALDSAELLPLTPSANRRNQLEQLRDQVKGLKQAAS
jgi:tetratricopeptide (TPR) repeat protein